jgi:hypothetical protein
MKMSLKSHLSLKVSKLNNLSFKTNTINPHMDTNPTHLTTLDTICRLRITKIKSKLASPISQ